MKRKYLSMGLHRSKQKHMKCAILRICGQFSGLHSCRGAAGDSIITKSNSRKPHCIHSSTTAALWSTYHSLKASSVEVLCSIVPDDVGSIAETSRTPVLDLSHFALVPRPT